MRIVMVKWKDMVTTCERYPESKIKDSQTATLYIVGFLVEETDQVIKVAHIKCDIPDAPEKIYSDFSVIPKADSTIVTVWDCND